MTSNSKEAPERIWIDAAPNLIAGSMRYVYDSPPDADLPIRSVEYVRADLLQQPVTSGDARLLVSRAIGTWINARPEINKRLRQRELDDLAVGITAAFSPQQPVTGERCGECGFQKGLDAAVLRVQQIAEAYDRAATSDNDPHAAVARYILSKVQQIEAANAPVAPGRAQRLAEKIADAVGFDPAVKLDVKGLTIVDIIRAEFGCKCVYPTTGAAGRTRAIELLRSLRNATDPAEVARQKESWAALEEDLKGVATTGADEGGERDIWDLLNKRRHELIDVKRDQGFLEESDAADFAALQRVAGLVRELLTSPLPATVVEGEAQRCGAFKPSILGVPEPQDQCTLSDGHEGKHTLDAPTPVQPAVAPQDDDDLPVCITCRHFQGCACEHECQYMVLPLDRETLLSNRAALPPAQAAQVAVEADLIDRAAAVIAINDLFVKVGPSGCSGYEERDAHNDGVRNALTAIEDLPVAACITDAGEVERLRQRARDAESWIADVEEREATVCPEDTPFDEYIRHLEKKLTETRANAIRACANALSERRKAYVESIFKPLADGETAKVHEQWPRLVDRMSADVCRWILDDMSTELELLAKEGDGDRNITPKG